MAHLFISYSRTDTPCVRTLVGDLEAIGHRVWMDHELTGGQSWWDEILHNIRECDLFVLALSPAALDSTACKREYRYAEALGKRILPVLVADGVSINVLPTALSAIQYVDYRTPSREAALALARTMMSIPEPDPLPDPLPEPPEVPISYLTHLKDQVDTSGILNFDEQAALAFRLKERLADPEVADDVRGLMRRFRARPDLLARVAEDIDASLVDDGTQTVTPPEHGGTGGAGFGVAAEIERPEPQREPRRPSPNRAPRPEEQARPRRTPREEAASRRDERRSRPRRERRPDADATRGPSSGRVWKIVGGAVCALFALSSFAYAAEWGDAFSLVLGILFAAAAYKLFTS